MKEKLKEGMEKVALAMTRPLRKPAPRVPPVENNGWEAPARSWLFEQDLGGSIEFIWSEQAEEIGRRSRIGMKREFLKYKALLERRMAAFR